METAKRPNAIYQAMLADAAKRRQDALKMQLAGRSLKEIGDSFGVSRERARQMVAAAIKENKA